MCTKGINEETTWRNVMENEKVTVAIESNEASKNFDPYCCAIQIKAGGSVGHIPREISQNCYFFMKEEGGEINGNGIHELIPFFGSLRGTEYDMDF